MEAFAEKLDRFRQQEHRSGEMGAFQAAYSLVKGFQVLAQGGIQELSRQNTLRRAKMGWNDILRESAPQAKSEEELQRLQLETETWELLLNLISIDDPSSRAHFKSEQETAFRNLHRYSSDREVWEQFLDADQYAQEQGMSRSELIALCLRKVIKGRKKSDSARAFGYVDVNQSQHMIGQIRHTGEQYDWKVWMFALEDFCDGIPIHSRHTIIKHNSVDVMFASQSNALRAVFGY